MSIKKSVDYSIEPTFYKLNAQNIEEVNPVSVLIADDEILSKHFSEDAGWAIMEFSLPAYTVNTYDYIFALHDNTSTEVIGVRIDLNTAYSELRGWAKSSGGNLHTSANGDKMPENTRQVMGLTWKDGAFTIVSGGKVSAKTIAGHANRVTHLNVLSRNGSQDPLDGYVHQVKIGRGFLPIKQLGAEMHRIGNIVLVVGGQSNGAGLFSTVTIGTEGGKTKLREVLGALFPDNVATMINGATGSSSAARTSDTTDLNWWWDNATGNIGSAFQTFYDNIDAAGVIPTHILWVQGEADASKIGSLTSRADYKNAVTSIFNHMRQTLSDLPIIIQKIGSHDGGSDNGFQAVREVQQELIDENDFIHFGADMYMEAKIDTVHLTDIGNQNVAERDARSIVNIIDAAQNLAGTFGASLASATLNGVTIDVLIHHDAGNDFTPLSAITGFYVTDDGAEIAVTSAVRLNSNTIRLTLASAPVGLVQDIYYAYGAMNTLDINNVIYDNASTIDNTVPNMPLRSGKISIGG